MFLTIVIPMRNEEAYVGRCLDSILPQVRGGDDVEVLLVDGQSTDCTREIAQAYADRDPRVRVIDNPGRIVPTAMNLAIREARGDVIMRLDCHAEYADDYVDACLRVLARTGADNVGGYMATRPGSDTPVGRAIAAATSSVFGVGGSRFRVGGGEETEVDTVPFGCFRREVFDKVGPFDERLVRNQDIEMNTRIRRHGGRIVISPEIRLTYYTRSTYAGLRQQAFYNGLWNPYTLYLLGGGIRPRHLVPMLFVLSLPALAALGLVWWGFWAVLAAEAGLYLAASLVMAWRAARRGDASTLRVMAAFWQLHVAYGVGSLWGLVTAPLKLRRRGAGKGDEVPAERRD